MKVHCGAHGIDYETDTIPKCPFPHIKDNFKLSKKELDRKFRIKEIRRRTKEMRKIYGNEDIGRIMRQQRGVMI